MKKPTKLLKHDSLSKNKQATIKYSLFSFNLRNSISIFETVSTTI